MSRLLAIVVAVSSITAVVLAQTKPAVPLEPIAAILDAFRTHDIVALGEGRHNNDPASEDTRVEDQFDAVIYLGPYSGITVARGDIAASLCADGDYIKMRLNRMALMEPPGAQPPPGVMSPSEFLKRYCETVANR